MNRLRHEDGVTLVELLASLALLSVVILLVGSAHLFGQKQYINQTYAAAQANDYAHSLSVITRELRGFDSVTVQDNRILNDGTVLFFQDGTRLIGPEGEVLAEDVRAFEVETDGANKNINIVLKSNGNNNMQPKEYQTTIHFRR